MSAFLQSCRVGRGVFSKRASPGHAEMGAPRKGRRPIAVSQSAATDPFGGALAAPFGGPLRCLVRANPWPRSALSFLEPMGGEVAGISGFQGRQGRRAGPFGRQAPAAKLLKIALTCRRSVDRYNLSVARRSPLPDRVPDGSSAWRVYCDKGSGSQASRGLAVPARRLVSHRKSGGWAGKVADWRRREVF